MPGYSRSPIPAPEYMIITCPHCGFARQIEADQLPANPVRATCPQCQGSFAFTPPAAAAAQTATGEARRERAVVVVAAAPKAGFWIRAVAAVLDMVAIGLLESGLGSLLVRLSGMEPGIHSPEGRAILFIVAAFGMVLGYGYRVCFIGYCGQTPGKMAVRIKVVRTDGAEAGYICAFLREVVGKFLSKLIFGIGYLMVAFDPRKQGLHDKIADTYVIRL